MGKKLFLFSCHFLTFLAVKPLVMSLGISDKAVKFLLRSIKLSFLSNYFASKNLTMSCHQLCDGKSIGSRNI